MRISKSAMAVAGLALTAALQLEAQTTVVYSDPFTGTAGSSLNGATPKDHGGAGTEAWIAPDDGLMMDGSAMVATSGSRWAALPFTPVDGNKYRVSVDLNPAHTGSDWFAVGFAETPTPTSDYGAQRLTGWMLLRGTDPGVPLHSFIGYGTDDGGALGSFTVTTSQVGIGTFHTYGFSNREFQLPGASVTLQIARGTGGSIVLSWAESAQGFTLESAPALPAAQWTSVSGVQNNRVTITPAAGNQFFRLRKP